MEFVGCNRGLQFVPQNIRDAMSGGWGTRRVANWMFWQKCCTRFKSSKMSEWRCDTCRRVEVFCRLKMKELRPFSISRTVTTRQHYIQAALTPQTRCNFTIYIVYRLLVKQSLTLERCRQKSDESYLNLVLDQQKYIYWKLVVQFPRWNT